MKAKLINETVSFERYKDPKKALFPDPEPTEEELYQKHLKDRSNFTTELIKLLNQANDNNIPFDIVNEIIHDAMNEIEWKEEY